MRPTNLRQSDSVVAFVVLVCRLMALPGQHLSSMCSIWSSRQMSRTFSKSLTAVPQQHQLSSSTGPDPQQHETGVWEAHGAWARSGVLSSLSSKQACPFSKWACWLARYMAVSQMTRLQSSRATNADIGDGVCAL